jgi:hypothetical protein
MEVNHSDDPPRVVVLDIMGRRPEWSIRVPRDLWDAYIISVVTPIVALAKKDLALFKSKHNDESPGRRDTRRLFDLIEIDFDIPDAEASRVLDWSYSNLRDLFRRGQAEGERFFREGYGARVPDRANIGI